MAIGDFVKQYMEEHLDAKFVYHNINHTEQVVQAVEDLGKAAQLGSEEIELLKTAAWFHDIGYCKNWENHEAIGVEIASAYLLEHNYTDEQIATVSRLILATKFPHDVNTLDEKLIADADLSHLASEDFMESCYRLRAEWESIGKAKYETKLDWLKMEAGFVENYNFHSEQAHEHYNKGKLKNLEKVKKQIKKLEKKSPKIETENKKKKKKKEKGDPPLSKGVETMFRAVYRNHINLSAIADNKANIMLSINALMISILVSAMIPMVQNNPNLAVPALVLLGVNVSSMVLAILATRPKITKGTATKEDILSNRSNLLFFGNFHNMKLDEYKWGMGEVMKNSELVYGSMIQDLYYLGLVLNKKYRFLSYCYQVFMWGMITAVLIFAYVLIAQLNAG